MATFIAIFTIDGGTNQDYMALRRLLEKAGFSKTIRDGQNIAYVLPPHTYTAITDREKSHVLEIGNNVARRLKKRFSLFVSKSEGSTWIGLDQA